MSKTDYILEKKSALFGLVFVFVIGALATPVILPHIFHGYHVFHILLHIIGISLSLFLTVIAAIAYYRLQTKRMLLTTVAFTIFAMAESITLVDATWPNLYTIPTMSLLELGHFFMIVSIGTLAMGVFRDD